MPFLLVCLSWQDSVHAHLQAERHESTEGEHQLDKSPQPPLKCSKKSVDIHVKVSTFIPVPRSKAACFHSHDIDKLLRVQMVKSKSKHVPFETLLKFALKIPSSKRNSFQKSIIASHRKLLQATRLLEGAELQPVLCKDSQAGASDASAGRLDGQGMVPACCLLLQACHECSHAPLLESLAWKAQKARFQLSSPLQKFLSKAGDDGFWHALAPFLGLAELTFMIVWLKDAILEQRLNGTSSVGGQLGQQILDGDRALESYFLFAENTCMVMLLCPLLFCSQLPVVYLLGKRN